MTEMAKVDAVAYRKFLSQIRIGEVRLESLSLTRREDPHGKGSLTIKCGPEQYTLNDGALRVPFVTTIKAESIDAESKPYTVFTLKARHSVSYSIPNSKIDENLLRLFVQSNVIINLWPYVRQLVNDLSFRMGVPPVVLGLQMTPSVQEEDEGSR